LACVEAVPSVVHIAVDLVAVFGDFVGDYDGLHSSIFTICVERLKQKNTKVGICAVTCIPIVSNDASRVGISIDGFFYIRNDLESWCSLHGDDCTTEFSAFKLKDNIIRRGARPLNAVRGVGP